MLIFMKSEERKVKKKKFRTLACTEFFELPLKDLKNLGLRQRLATTEHPHSRKPIQVCRANL